MLAQAGVAWGSVARSVAPFIAFGLPRPPGHACVSERGLEGCEVVPFAYRPARALSECARALASPRLCLRKWACPGGVRWGVMEIVTLPLGARYKKDLAHEPVPGRLDGLGGVGEGAGLPRIESAEGGFD